MRKNSIFLIIFILIFVSSSAENNFFQNTNVVDSLYLNMKLSNPAATFNSPEITYYSFSLKNLMNLNHYAINVNYNDIDFNLSGIKRDDFYVNTININSQLNEYLKLGVNFNLLYKYFYTHNIYNTVDLGVNIEPFNQTLKESGQYINLVFSLFCGNIFTKDIFKDDFPFYTGFGMGIFYKKDILKIQIETKKIKNDIFLGLNIMSKLYNKNYVNLSFTQDTLSLSLYYNIKDIIFIPSYYFYRNNHGFNMAIVIIPGQYKRTIIEDIINDALNEYRRKNYKKALDYFVKASVLDKNNKEVKQFINIIKERLDESKKTEVNIKILHIIKLIKKKRLSMAKKEFLALKKRYPEFEYKWKILYNKFKVNKKTQGSNGSKVIKTEKKPQDLSEFKEIEKLIQEGQLRLATTKMESIRINKENQLIYNEVKKKLDEKIINAKESLLSKITPETTLQEKIAIYEEILLKIDEDDIHKKDVINYYMRKGENYYRQGQYDKAIEMWKKVLAIEKDNTDALIYIETTKKKMEREK